MFALASFLVGGQEMISEYDDHASSSGAGDALDMSAPLSERVIDKNFRMRIASLPELIALLENAGIDGDDSIFARYCSFILLLLLYHGWE